MPRKPASQTVFMLKYRAFNLSGMELSHYLMEGDRCFGGGYLTDKVTVLPPRGGVVLPGSCVKAIQGKIRVVPS